MKRILFTVCLITSFCTSTFSQSKARFGVNGGLTYSSFRGNSEIESFDHGLGFFAGVTLEYQLSQKLSLMSAINLEKKSASKKLDEQPFMSPTEIEFENEFITVPILIKLNVEAKSSFYVVGGPFLSYIVTSKISDNYPYLSTYETDDHNTFDFGLVFGLGKTFKLNNGQLSFEIRENLGLTDISSINGPIKTNSLNFVCGYSFDIN